MKKQLLLMLLMMLPLVASADAVEINGIYYNLITKVRQAEVTSNPYKYKKTVEIPETVDYNNVTYSVTSIANSAFEKCSGLTSVIIPNSVMTIGNSAFYLCSNLTSVIIPNSVTTIGFDAFSACLGLTSVTIGNSVTTIGSGAFYNCSKLTSVIIPNSVTSIGDRMFCGCSGLTSVIIPNSVTSIGWNSFRDCSALTSITIPNSVTSIGESAFGGCSSLVSVTIPNSVVKISKATFSGCSSLASINIPNKVTSIDEKALYGCLSLTSITIGSKIQSIGSKAFAKCSNLTDVNCYANKVPNTNSDAFDESYIDYVTLHVPAASVNLYKAAEPWKNFKSIVAVDGSTPEKNKCEKPTISYENGQLKMSCATEGVEYVTDITDADVKKHYDSIISLTAAYNISVYASKTGYENSETVTATLCWIDATPQMEGTTNGLTQINARPVLVKSDNGFITVEGVDDRTNVNIFTTDGKQVGSVISHNNRATIATSIQPGSIAIVKIGEKSVKVVVH